MFPIGKIKLNRTTEPDKRTLKKRLLRQRVKIPVYNLLYNLSL